MLEHANNIQSADGVLEWRIHHYGEHDSTDRPIRFYQAVWANHPLPFRFEHLPKHTELNPIYEDLIARGKNTVITAHLNYWRLIDQFKHRMTVQQDQIMIHLYSQRSKRVWHDLCMKRNCVTPVDTFEQQHMLLNDRELVRPDYALHIDIEHAWRSWDYMQDCMDQLGIDLSKDVYDHYLTFIADL